MDTEIICCKTIEMELQAAMAAAGIEIPCRWIESGLHNPPARLTARLQAELDAVPSGVGRVLLGFAFCGNAIAGLRSGDFELIVPRADDCITLLLGSYKRRQQIMKEAPAYFLTEGWLRGERNIWAEYQHTLQRYGEARARRIFRAMLANYRRLIFVDSGVSDLSALLPETERIAAALELHPEVAGGTLGFLTTLLTGPWDDAHFLVVPPHTKIEENDLTIDGCCRAGAAQ